MNRPEELLWEYIEENIDLALDVWADLTIWCSNETADKMLSLMMFRCRCEHQEGWEDGYREGLKAED